VKTRGVEVALTFGVQVVEVEAFEWLGRTEGILPALDSSHAIAWVREQLPHWPANTVALVNLSGRGDKDVETVRRLRGER
jgi:tryptophan synthase beta chain